MRLRVLFRWLRRKPLVRPWALSAPIVVLLVALPLMRPLRHPDPRTISDDEQARLATIESVVERNTLQIEHSPFRGTRDKIERTVAGRRHWFSNQSPVMAVLLSGPYWVMHRFGLTLREDPILAEYLLTLLGVTLPVALAAGLLYRMGRLFELKRPVRAGLALAAVLGTGWISYATVLNAHAAAAALVVAAAACLVQSTVTRHRWAPAGWMILAGACAALAATYDLAAALFLVLLVLFISALRWRLAPKLGAIALYCLGAVGPLALYSALNVQTTGDLKPGFLHPELHSTTFAVESTGPQEVSLSPTAPDEEEEPTRWHLVLRSAERLLEAFFGEHGLLSHFPVLVFGVIGVSMVMHRHWPTSTKMLASATMAVGATVILVCAARPADWTKAMFATRWFVVFLPMTLFWAGAWLRRRHRPTSWAVAGMLLAFSVGVSILGATDPQPREGFDRYTAAGALMHLVNPPKPKESLPMIAAR